VIGKISYGLYLYHLLVAEAAGRFLHQQNKPLLLLSDFDTLTAQRLCHPE
jgi:peptidoglycan/LPS O-acetylase OafA/YrhL